MNAQDIGERIRDAAGFDAWFALPLGVRFRIVKAVVAIVREAELRGADQ